MITEEQKKQNRVYIVISYGGEYEDSWEHILCTYTDYLKALSAAKKVCDEHVIDESKLPMSFDEYSECGYGYPDCDKVYADMDDDERKYYDTLIDRDGHTVEEFKIMADAQNKLYDDFLGCQIVSLLLDSDVENNEKAYIYVKKEEDGTFIID